MSAGDINKIVGAVLVTLLASTAIGQVANFLMGEEGGEHGAPPAAMAPQEPAAPPAAMAPQQAAAPPAAMAPQQPEPMPAPAPEPPAAAAPAPAPEPPMAAAPPAPAAEAPAGAAPAPAEAAPPPAAAEAPAAPPPAEAPQQAQAPAGGGENLAQLIAAADVTAARRLMVRCVACHSWDEAGANKVGPALWGVVGRPKGSHAGYEYSDAMKAKGGDWSYEDLNAFLENPKGFVDGTKMTFAGLANPADRAAIIAFLRAQSSNPPPLP